MREYIHVFVGREISNGNICVCQAAIGTMKIVLNSISEKLASHDKFLKDSNARIKNLKSSVSVSWVQRL